MKDIYWIVCMIMIITMPIALAGSKGVAIICLQLFFVCWYGIAVSWIDDHERD
jgi:hypothetical protein